MLRRALVAAIILAPALASAATNDAQIQLLLAKVDALKAQITSIQEGSAATLPQTAAAGVRLCVAPTRTLTRGNAGDDIANLQQFLAQDPSIYPEGIVNGTYGPATERAVARWQKTHGVVSSGTPATTGYGAVGSRTLALMHTLWSCGGTISAVWFTATPGAGAVIFSAQASSSAPLDASLSVDFGDGSSAPVVVTSTVCAQTAGSCSSVLTTSHTYAAAGTYTAKLMHTRTTQHCLVTSQTCGDGATVCAHLAPICSPETSEETLATTAVQAGGGVGLNGSTIVPGSVAASVSAAPPAIKILLPTAGAKVGVGSSVTIAWSSQNAPTGSSVTIALGNKNGTSIGTIIANQRSYGTYWWLMPAPATSGCTGDVLSCLAQLAGPVCTSDLCEVPAGTYSILAKLVSTNGAILASASSSPFTVAVSASTVASTASIAATSTTPSTAAVVSSGSTAASGTSGTTNAQSCLYSGVQYPSGLTLNVGCTDLAGGSCSAYGGLALTCTNGQWLTGSGSAPSIQNVTTYSGGTACTTPWGGQRVQSGQQITYEPFFTGGQYTGAQTNVLMQCTTGAWQKCAWDGTGCQAYTVI